MRDYVYGYNCSGRPVRLSQKYGFDLLSEADNLFDGGWNSTDKELLVHEFQITEEEAETLCEILAWFEKLESEECDE